MTLPSSGAMSASMINTELGRAATTTMQLNDSAVRQMAGKSSGQISFSDLYGKSLAKYQGTITIGKSATTLGYFQGQLGAINPNSIDGTTFYWVGSGANNQGTIWVNGTAPSIVGGGSITYGGSYTSVFPAMTVSGGSQQVAWTDAGLVSYLNTMVGQTISVSIR